MSERETVTKTKRERGGHYREEGRGAFAQWRRLFGSQKWHLIPVASSSPDIPLSFTPNSPASRLRNSDTSAVPDRAE